jgi:CheY-like chemotaxis protein
MQPAASQARAPLGLTLQGRLIVVVEDEAAVREGLVRAAAGLGRQRGRFRHGGVTRTLAGQPAGAAPDLLLVDYRLPQGAPARRAGRAARAGRARLPAIVITGSTPRRPRKTKPPSTTTTC